MSAQRIQAEFVRKREADQKKIEFTESKRENLKSVYKQTSVDLDA